MRQLETELSATRQTLQSNIEQLKSLNEELQSSNEELQAANEELETSREELQSLNEELITVNSQLQSKIEEEEEINDDLNNFLVSTNIPTIFLDPQFRVKRFTPAMSRIIKLIPADVGRPIIDMSQEHLGPDFIADARTVMDNLVPIRKEIGINGVWYVRTALPYRTSDNRIEGMVITYNDITELKRAEERTRHLASFPQLNPNPVIEVDSSGKVIFFNPATQKILESLGMDKGDVRAFLPTDLGAILKDWDKQNELTLYREVNVKDRVFGGTVYLTPRFDVARIYLLDITERKKAEQALRKAHDGLEMRVKERTAELVKLNEELEIEIAERRKAEETAKTERQRLYDVLETLPVYVVLLTPDYHVPFANKFFRDRFGESHGERCFEYLFGRTEPCEICETYSVLKTMKPHHWEWTGPDGRNYDIYDFPFIDADGSTLILEMGIDITERRQAEKALKEINETLEQRVAERTTELHKEKTISETTIESLPGIFYLFDWQGRFLKWNRNFQQVSGYTAEELSSMHPLDFFMGKDKRLIEQRLQEVFTTGESAAEAEFVSKDGHRTAYFFTGVKTSIDNTECLIGMGVDITDRKRAEEALRESERRLARSQEIAHLGSWELDPVKNELVWSDEVYRIFGLQPQEFGATYEAFLERVHPDDRSVVDAAYSGSIREGKDSYEIEHRVVRKDTGEVRWVHEKCQHFRDESGRIVRSVGMVHDITERKRAEEQLKKAADELKRSNVALRQFAYAASHDLREPLRNMASFVKLLERRYKNKIDEKADQYIDYIVDSSRRMQALIEDLLDYSRLETKGKLLESVNCNELIDKTITDLHASINESKAEVTHDPLPNVTADPLQLSRLFQNLISNAIKYRGTGTPRIHISASRGKDEWVFSVRDNGIGIDPEYFEKIFVIFQRLHSREEYPGTGIGLAICKKIVELHGGRIWVDSGPGKGSTFYFTIPDKK